MGLWYRFIRGCVSWNLDAWRRCSVTQNISASPVSFVTLSGPFIRMLRDARRYRTQDSRFSFEAFDCARILMKTEALIWSLQTSGLFYCEDILIKGGRFNATPGGKLSAVPMEKHMQEVSRLVRDFDVDCPLLRRQTL